jgi:hypothetical protein
VEGDKDAWCVRPSELLRAAAHELAGRYNTFFVEAPFYVFAGLDMVRAACRDTRRAFDGACRQLVALLVVFLAAWTTDVLTLGYVIGALHILVQNTMTGGGWQRRARQVRCPGERAERMPPQTPP